MTSANFSALIKHLRPTRLSICLVSLIVLGLGKTAASAQESWSQFVNGSTAAVFKIDTAGLQSAPLADAFANETIFIAVDIPASRFHPVLRVFTKAQPTGDLPGWAHGLPALELSGPQRDGDYFRYSLMPAAPARGAAEIDSALLQHDPQQLQAAVAALREAPLQAVILPPKYVRDTVRDLLPVMPAKLGGGPSSILTEGFLWASLSADPQQSGARLEIQSASADAAERLAAHLPVLARHLSQALEIEELMLLDQSAEPETRDNRILIQLDAAPLMAIAALVSQRVTNQMATSAARDQLRRIAIAIHNFHDAHGHFPPPAEGRDDQGKPRLSWRVHLLPYLDEAELYAQFRLDEAWDSPHNRPLVDKIPQAFASPKLPEGHTVLLAPVGEKTIFGGTEPVRVQDVTDGTVNTVMVVMVAPDRAVPWTAPEDFAFDPAQPSVGMARDPSGHFPVVFADGSYRLLPGDQPAQGLLHLFQINDGNIVRW
jgi:hypothetical protein